MAKQLPDGDLLVEGKIEMTGVIVDEFGNKWTLPADDKGEDFDFLVRDPFKIPRKDPKFRYEFVDAEFVPDFQNGPYQWALVSREEAGVTSVQKANRVEGGPDVMHSKNEAYKLGGGGSNRPLYLMKTPEALARRIDKVKQRAADDAVKACLTANTERQREAIDRIRGAGLRFQVDQADLSTLKVKEKNEKPFREVEE